MMQSLSQSEGDLKIE